MPSTWYIPSMVIQYERRVKCTTYSIYNLAGVHVSALL